MVLYIEIDLFTSELVEKMIYMYFLSIFSTLSKNYYINYPVFFIILYFTFYLKTIIAPRVMTIEILFFFVFKNNVLM